MHSVIEWGKIVNAFSLLISTMERSFPGADKGNSIKQHLSKPVAILPKLVLIRGFSCMCVCVCVCVRACVRACVF